MTVVGRAFPRVYVFVFRLVIVLLAVLVALAVIARVRQGVELRGHPGLWSAARSISVVRTAGPGPRKPALRRRGSVASRP